MATSFMWRLDHSQNKWSNRKKWALWHEIFEGLLGNKREAGKAKRKHNRRRSLRTDLAQNRSRLGRRIGGFRDRPPDYDVASSRGDCLGGGNDTDLVGNVSASGAYSRSDDCESLPEF